MNVLIGIGYVFMGFGLYTWVFRPRWDIFGSAILGIGLGLILEGLG